MKSGLKDLSIIIVTYDGDDMLKNCLDSLVREKIDKSQIVVVDNLSSKRTRKLVYSYKTPLYIANAVNSGFAGGNNKALSFCRGKYILLLNNDTIVHSRESILELIEFLDENPKAAVAQGTMVLPLRNGNIGGCGTYLTPFGFMMNIGFDEKDNPSFHEKRQIFSAVGAFMMIRRETLAETDGLFRTHFWSYYEESDFCHRVHLAGKEVWYVPTKPIDHLCGKTSQKFPRADIMARFLRNGYFSLSVNLSAHSRFFILPLFSLTIIFHALLSLLRGNYKMFIAEMNIFRDIASSKKKIAAARRRISTVRKVSDSEIFSKTMKFPSLGYLARNAFKS
jgi:GT2 family glycosyltransferase